MAAWRSVCVRTLPTTDSPPNSSTIAWSSLTILSSTVAPIGALHDHLPYRCPIRHQSLHALRRIHPHNFPPSSRLIKKHVLNLVAVLKHIFHARFDFDVRDLLWIHNGDALDRDVGILETLAEVRRFGDRL